MFLEAARRHGLHAAALLGAGVSVVLGFAANSRAQRRWPRTIAETARVRHRLPVLDVGCVAPGCGHATPHRIIRSR